jgi:arylsulfatase A-like enzyme
MLVVVVMLSSNSNNNAFAQSDSSPAEKPNILWVMTDDQDFRSWRRMPEVRKLAKEGVSFERSFVTTSQCCPSRSTWLTGQYAHNHQVKEQVARFGGGYEKVRETGLEERALPTWLNKEGYVTAYGGKYMNQYYEADSVPPGWDRWFGFTKGMGNENRYFVNENGSERYFNRASLASVDYLSLRGQQFARNTDRYNAPFFLGLAPFTPHKPYFYPKRYENTFDHMKAPRFPNFDEEDRSDKPPVVQGFEGGDPDHYDRVYRDRMRGLLGVNDMIRGVREELEANGEWQDTIVVFTSDNGYLVGEHDWEGKSIPYEGSARVPFIAAGPGIPENEKRYKTIANIDWAPTIADWTGATPKTEVDGRSLKPLIQDPTTPWRQRILIEAWGLFQFSAVRAQYEMYAEYRELGERSEAKEYYNLREDFHQLENAYPEMPADRREEMQRQLKDLRECSGASCREADN